MNHHEVRKIQVGPYEKKLLLEKLNTLDKKIMIVGDIGLDEYLIGEVHRISPEAPVPILEVQEEEARLGLAANVAQNITSLGGQPILISVIGNDFGGEILDTLFKNAGVSSEYLVRDQTRPTTRKTRVLAQHHHIVRVDHEVRQHISSLTEEKILEKVLTNIDQVDAVIIQDYAKGVLTHSIVKKIVEIAKLKSKKVFVDPHRSNSASFYEGVDLIKPNFDEGVSLSKMDGSELRSHPHKIIEVGLAVKKLSHAKTVVLTRGKDGMMIFSENEIVEVPTYARKVYDVTGAGDTVIAALSLGLASNLDFVHSCMLANFAAGVVVGKVGCVPCELKELAEYIEILGR